MFEYDRGGNITAKKRYAFTTGTLGSLLQTISYTYGDSNWKDKMTKYNGTTVSYDTIGNPTGDGTWSYTWQAGRQLASMSKSGTALSFSYDHNGLRTQKSATVSGVTTTTNYYLNGKQIVHLTQGSNTLHFFYDAQGKPAMVQFGSNWYSFVYSLQGDVVGLLDSAGLRL